MKGRVASPCDAVCIYQLISRIHLDMKSLGQIYLSREDIERNLQGSYFMYEFVFGAYHQTCTVESGWPAIFTIMTSIKSN